VDIRDPAGANAKISVTRLGEIWAKFLGVGRIYFQKIAPEFTYVNKL
jgi:hypothetical protein